MYSVADMCKIFLSTNNITDYKNDLHQYFEQNTPNQTIINYEGEGSVMSEPMSLSSSSVATDIQTGNCAHNPKESSERRDNGLCSIYEISTKYRHIFASYPCFNAIQSKVLNDVLYSDASIVVSAPTGSGKTVIFELAIIRLLTNLEAMEYAGQYKIVYMAPVKALCSERFQDWRSKFLSLGLSCKEYTGDTDEYDLDSLLTYHLILTTPEKWDSLTRKWKNNKGIVQMVKLFLIDEVHLLNEEERGPTLEAVVSRMKTVQGAIGATEWPKQNQSDPDTLLSGIRFLAVSATIPNTEDIACWLGESPDYPARFYKINDDMRPVKLQKIVLCYPHPAGASQFHFEMSLSYKLRTILFKYADGKPTLIFCSTRKGVEHTCSTLIQQITFNFSAEQKERISEVAIALNDNKLKECVMAGVGYHHAGMGKEDRQALECLFREGMLPVLVTTSTLAMGVNLPAHLVIIKATQQYIGGSYKDYTDTQILQMIGRAGRPQFDTSAVAIIMTKESHRSRYEKAISGKDLIESNLHRHLAEHLNSEVVLRTVTDIGYAMEWIRSTYLYVRALQNPSHYGIPCSLNKKGIEGKLQEMCQRELNALASAKLLTIDHRMDVHPTKDGALMARFYLNLGTMQTFHKVDGHESLQEILQIVAACHEFSGMKLRVSEKKNLNLLNKARDRECIRFPLPTRITTTEMKINCLIQAFLGCLPIHEPSLKQDVFRITWIGKRVTNALVQYLLQRPHYRALVSAITLTKCFYCKLWENSPYMSRQLKGIGAALSSMLAVSNKTSFQSIMESNPRDLESILNRPPPTGDNLKAEVDHLPRFELRTVTATNMSTTQLRIYVDMTNRAIIQKHNTAGKNHWIFLLVGDSNNKCIYKERFKDTRLLEDTECWTMEIKDPSSVNEVYVNLISEQWVGLDVHSSIKLQQPKQTIPLEAKNSIGEYLKKQGMNNGSLSSKLPRSQTLKRAKSSIIDKIKEISEKRFGNIVSVTPTILTLNKTAYTPAKRIKLLPPLEQLKKTEDGQNDDMPQFHNPDRCPTEQINPEIQSRHVKPKLTTDEETHSLHKPSSLGHTSTDVNQLQDGSTKSCKDPEMQLNQSRITKCKADQEQHNASMLQDGGTCQSAVTEHTPLLTAETGSEYKVHRTQETNSKVHLTKLPQNNMSHNDFKLTKPSTSKSTECSYTPFKENIELCESSILEDKHFEEKMNKNFVSRLTIPLQPSGEEYLETETSVIFNPQLTNNSSSHNNSLLEEYSSEESKTKECDFQNVKTSKYKRVIKPPSITSLDAHFSLHKIYLKTEMLPANPPTSDKDVTRQNDAVRLSSDGESKQLDFQEEHIRHGLAIMSDNRSVHLADPPVNREHTHTNAKQNAYSLNTKERKRLLFQKTLPKHYYPVFMKSLQSDTTGPAHLHATNRDHLKEPSNEVASSFLMKENVTFSGILSESRKESTQCNDGTWAADSENVIKRVKETQPLPQEEANLSNTAQIKSESSVLEKSCKSQHVSEGSRTSENRPEVEEDRSTENEKTDGDSEPKDYPVPNFDLVKDIDSFLVGIFHEDNRQWKATNIHNKKDNKNFMANVPISTKYLDRNKLVSHGFPDNGNGYLHRITRNDMKYEHILNLLLKDVSKKEIMSSSSIMEANEQYDTNVLSSSQLQFQFQPQSHTTYANLGAKNRLTLSHFTQKPEDHDSVIITNKNSKHIPPFSNFTQTLQTHNPNQSDYCNRTYTQSKFNCQPSLRGGYTNMSCDSDGTSESINGMLQRNETSRRWNYATSINIPMEQLKSKFNCQPSVRGGYSNMSYDSDGTPESINGMLQINETSRRWNYATSINVPMEQLTPFREKKSYPQISEFGNSLCTQPQLSPLQDTATTRAALYTPTKHATGDTESSPNLNSQWQKFQMSPLSSDDSPEVYY